MAADAVQKIETQILFWRDAGKLVQPFHSHKAIPTACAKGTWLNDSMRIDGDALDRTDRASSIRLTGYSNNLEW